MRGKRFLLLSIIYIAAILSGCAKYPADAGFQDVREQVADRTGLDVQWYRNQDGQSAFRTAVRVVPTQELTVDTAVQITLLQNMKLQAIYEDLGIAQADVVAAGQLKNPTLSATIGLPRYTALPYQIDISQDFIDLLMMPVHKRISGAEFEAAKLRVTTTVIDMATQVKAAFYRAQGAAQMVELCHSALDVADAAWETAQRVHAAGNLTDLALATQEAEHEQAKIEMIKAQQRATDAADALDEVMGTEVQWKIAPRLPDLPASESDLQHAESLAISRRPDLAAARQHARALGDRLGLTKSTAFLADAKLGVDIDQDVDGPFFLGPTFELPLPIFNQGQPAIAAAVSQFRQSQSSYWALRTDIRKEVRRARDQLLAARDLAEYYHKVLIPLRQQITKLEQLQFNAMRVNLFELLEAKRAEVDAGRDYLQTLQEYWVARAELEHATGGKIDSPLPAATQEHR